MSLQLQNSSQDVIQRIILSFNSIHTWFYRYLMKQNIIPVLNRRSQILRIPGVWKKSKMSWIEKPKFSVFETFNLTDLRIDEAWLKVTNGATRKLWLYELSSDCHEVIKIQNQYVFNFSYNAVCLCWSFKVSISIGGEILFGTQYITPVSGSN